MTYDYDNNYSGWPEETTTVVVSNSMLYEDQKGNVLASDNGKPPMMHHFINDDNHSVPYGYFSIIPGIRIDHYDQTGNIQPFAETFDAGSDPEGYQSTSMSDCAHSADGTSTGIDFADCYGAYSSSIHDALRQPSPSSSENIDPRIISPKEEVEETPKLDLFNQNHIYEEDLCIGEPIKHESNIFKQFDDFGYHNTNGQRNTTIQDEESSQRTSSFSHNSTTPQRRNSRGSGKRGKSSPLRRKLSSSGESSSSDGRAKNGRIGKRKKTQLGCKQCGQYFNNHSELRKHTEKHHTKPYKCIFSTMGCDINFGARNEWKRHIQTQHLQLIVWRCRDHQCRRSIFNRKDLFGKHIERMHYKNRKAFIQSDAGKAIIRREQEECQIVRTPPLRCKCGLCDEVFEGEDPWHKLLEHVGQHYHNDDPFASREWNKDPDMVAWVNKNGVPKICSQEECDEEMNIKQEDAEDGAYEADPEMES